LLTRTRSPTFGSKTATIKLISLKLTVRTIVMISLH